VGFGAGKGMEYKIAQGEKMKLIDILGVKYELRETSEELDKRLAGLDGYHDAYGKIICLNNVFKEKSMNSDQKRGLKPYKNEVLRHEIIHSFLFESGCWDYSQDEKIVAWIAIQFPKLLEIFKKLNCI